MIKSIPEDSMYFDSCYISNILINFFPHMAGDFCPPTKGVVVFETIEQAQRAANTFTGDEHSPKVK